MGWALISPVFFSVDIVFFIYLYQRWIYRVDPKRVNEFGTSGEDHNAPLTGGSGQEGGRSGQEGDGSGQPEAIESVEDSETVQNHTGQSETDKTMEEKKND